MGRRSHARAAFVHSSRRKRLHKVRARHILGRRVVGSKLVYANVVLHTIDIFILPTIFRIYIRVVRIVGVPAGIGKRTQQFFRWPEYCHSGLMAKMDIFCAQIFTNDPKRNWMRHRTTDIWAPRNTVRHTKAIIKLSRRRILFFNFPVRGFANSLQRIAG